MHALMDLQAKRDVELSEQEFPIKSLGAVHCMLQYNKNTNDGKEMSEAQEKEALQQCQLSALVPLGKDDVQPIVGTSPLKIDAG